MYSFTVAAIVLGCTFGAALVGLFLHRKLESHLDTQSRDVIKLVMGLIGTMSALILGLLIASADSSYKAQKSALQTLSADIVLADRLLASYGVDTKKAREELRSAIRGGQERIWSRGAPQPANLNAAANFIEHLQNLSPKTETAKILQSRVFEVAVKVMQSRLLMSEQAEESLPRPFLTLLVFWICALFLGFGLFTRSNATVVAALLLGAASVSAAIFLIFELSTPYRGIMQISDAPLRHALSQIGG
jgi:hypothetical protein